MYTARVVAVSSVTAAGTVEVRYDIYIDGVLAYSNEVVIGGTVQEIVTTVKARLAEIKNARERLALIKVGQEISI